MLGYIYGSERVSVKGVVNNIGMGRDVKLN